VDLGECRWPDVESFRTRVAVLPLGSLEQHGHHLPLLTDTFNCSEIARRARLEVEDEAVFLPILWIAVSEHHSGFPGTMSVRSTVYAELLEDMVESLIRAGFRRILLLNAHGGNVIPDSVAIYDVQLRHADDAGLWLVLGSWWSIAAEQIAAIESLQQKEVSHACEQETSIMLRLRPDLVDLGRASGATIPYPSDFYVPDFSKPSRIDVPRRLDQLSATGAFGSPELASAEKGEAILAAASGEVAALIREIARWPQIRPAQAGANDSDAPRSAQP